MFLLAANVSLVCLNFLILKSHTNKNIKLYGPFIWMGFNCLKSTKPLWGDSLLLTTRSPGVHGTHTLDIRRMKGWVNLEEINTTNNPVINNINGNECCLSIVICPKIVDTKFKKQDCLEVKYFKKSGTIFFI